MSLLVHLPLIKDFKNHGLSDLKFSCNTQYRYIRFVIDAIKGGSDTYTQLSRLEFIDTEGNLYEYPSGTTVSTNMSGYSASESPSNIIDGNVNTKFCCPWSAGGYLQIDLGSTETIDINKYSRFQWYTANDGDWRDPISFRMLFSVDGINFSDGVTVTNASITADRFTLAYTGNCLSTALVPNGKIGSTCYYNNSNYAGGVLSSTKLKALGSNVSMFAWVKLDNFNINPIGIGGTHTIIGSGYPAGTGMGFNIVQNPANANIWVASVNTGDGSTRTWNAYYGSTAISAGSWYHIGFTYDGTYIRIYVNGKLDATHTYIGQSNPADYVHVFSWSRDGTIATPTIFPHYNPVGSINDFRIYDHVLTPKEIKLLSQGLVAHYQLKGIGRTNYLKGSGLYTEKNPLIRNANDVGHMNDSYVYHNGVLSATIPADGTYTFILESDGVPSGHNTSGTVNTSRYFSMWLQNESTGTHYCWGSFGTGVGGEKYGQFTVPAGTYKVRTNLYAADNVNYTVKMWNMKFVQGSYDPTDVWCPHTEDELYNLAGFGTGAEIDCSGYGNNGEKNTMLEVVADSPRYGTCYRFTGSQYINCGRGAMVRDAITVSCWGYMSDWSDYTNRRMISCTEGGGWNLEPNGETSSNGMCFAIGTGTSSNSYLTAVSNTLCKNLSAGWHMFTGTFDGRTARIYIDGVHQGTSSTLSSKTPVFYNSGNSIFIGAEAGASGTSAGGQYFLGNISDVRIYGTALSAEDISDLYKNAASLHKNGTLFGYEFKESKQNSVNKNGVIVSSAFNDKTIPTYDMKIKALADGSTWARIHNLDLTYDKTFFNTSEVAKCTEKNNRYSRMGIVDKYKSSGEYEFMLTYPSMKKSVPAGYTELEYIEATGSQWINTGVTGNARWEFDIEFKTGVGYRQLMGYGGNGQEYWGVQVHGGYGVHEDQTLVGVTAGKRDTVVHCFGENNEYSIWVQNKSVPVDSRDVSSSQYQLFGIGTGTANACHAKLYRCKCIKGGSLVRDFIPAVRNSDGVIGLIDVVNNVFYGNSDSGTFVAGYKKEYQWLDYIQNTGRNYIDTGYPAPEGFVSEAVIEYVTTTGGGYVLGSHNTSEPWGRNGYGLNANGYWEIGSGDTCPASSSQVVANTRYTVKASTVKGNSYLDVNGTRVISTTDSTSRCTSNIWVFYNQYSNYHNHSVVNIKLYSLKFWLPNGTLIRDFVPCVNASGNVGLYDKVTKRFYGGRGTGNFIAGTTKESLPLYNRWIQTSSPTATSVSGFKPIHTSWTAHNYGIRKHGSECLYNCDSGGTWYAPIGQYTIWEGGIPAADGTMQTMTELWVRTDRFSNANKLSIYNDSITATDYLEI